MYRAQQSDPAPIVAGGLPSEIIRELAILLSHNPSLLQAQAFHQTVSALQAARTERWQTLADQLAGIISILSSANVITPCLFAMRDSAGRTVPKPIRATLRSLYLKASAVVHKTSTLSQLSRLSERSLTASLIAIDKGAIHIARENCCYLLNLLNREFGTDPDWPQTAADYASRSPNAIFRAP